MARELAGASEARRGRAPRSTRATCGTGATRHFPDTNGRIRSVSAWTGVDAVFMKPIATQSNYGRALTGVDTRKVSEGWEFVSQSVLRPTNPNARRPYLVPLAVFQHHRLTDAKEKRLLGSTVNRTVIDIHVRDGWYSLRVVVVADRS